MKNFERNQQERSVATRAMRRVYFIWFCRKAFGLGGLRLLVLAAVLWPLLVYVSWVNVFNNAFAAGWRAQPIFWWSALTGADISILALTVALLFLGGWLIRDLWRSLRHRLLFDFS